MTFVTLGDVPGLSTFILILLIAHDTILQGGKMSRRARQYSQSGLYHIVFRGINRQNIFEEDVDFIQFKSITKDLKQEMQFQIYAYCLMSNHVHILLNECSTGDISLIMKKLLVRYAGWFNRKYLRSGALIGSRFKSKPVDKDEYLLPLVRYIHQNPIRAKTVTDLNDYKWSSYSEYIHESSMTDTEFILSMMDKKSFKKYHLQKETESHEISDRLGKSEEDIKRRIKELIDGREPHVIGLMTKIERNQIIKKLKEDEGFSIRQIERATGVSRGIIANIDNKGYQKVLMKK